MTHCGNDQQRTGNNDAHVRVWVAQVPADGTYTITTDGQVNGFIDPRLAFGHKSTYGFLVWVFVAMFAVGLIRLTASKVWLGRTRRKAVVTAHPSFSLSPPVVMSEPPASTHEPSDEGVRLERLKTIAALWDFGR